MNRTVTNLSWKCAGLLLTALLLSMYCYGKSANAGFEGLANGATGACLVNDASFKTEDGGCKDLTTGIVWGDDSRLNYSGESAVNYCEQLVEGGFDDWALASKADLIEVAANGATGHLDIAPGAGYISSTTRGKDRIWMVTLTDGYSFLTRVGYGVALCNRHPSSGSGDGAPTNLTAKSISSGQIDLTWVDNSSSETNYEVQWSLNQVQWEPESLLPANSTSFSDTSLESATRYYYRVRALDPDTEFSDTASTKTKRG